MILKRIASMVLSCTMLALLASCSTDSTPTTDTAQTVSLKVWCAGEDKQLTEQLIDEFTQQNTDTTYDIDIGIVGEKDTQTKLFEDPAAAADIFSFPDDQITDLHSAGALYEITLNADAIREQNSSGSVEAATINDALYAYPMTADNGYFLYYDKSVVKNTDTLEGVLDDCNKAGKKFYMDISNGWYCAAFFLTAGCEVDLDDNGKQECNFDSEDGIKAGEYVKALCQNEAFITGEDAVLTGGMGDTIAAGVSGIWNAEAISEKLGDNYAAVKLPTIELDGEAEQLRSFAGYKLLGVNSATKYPKEAMALAEFMTNYDSQIKRFEMREAGPSNIQAAATDAVKQNIALAALADQSQYGESQRGILSTFWDPVEAFGTAMETKDYSKDIPTLLKSMVTDITT